MFDSEIEYTPPEMRESAQKLALNILPEVFATGAIVTPPRLERVSFLTHYVLVPTPFFYYF
jgi:hypothetical protein